MTEKKTEATNSPNFPKANATQDVNAVNALANELVAGINAATNAATNAAAVYSAAARLGGLKIEGRAYRFGTDNRKRTFDPDEQAVALDALTGHPSFYRLSEVGCSDVVFVQDRACALLADYITRHWCLVDDAPNLDALGDNHYSDLIHGGGDSDGK